MTDRVVAATPATLSHRFGAAGAADVHVTATTADGTTVLDDVAATEPGEGSDLWTVTVPAADLVGPTLLTVQWDAGGGWVEVDQVEVAGARYLLPADLKEGSQEGEGLARARFTDALLEAAIVVAEWRIEKATSTAWVPRWGRDTVTLRAGLQAWLPPALRTITEVVVSGAGVTPWEDDPAMWSTSPLGLVTRTAPVRAHLAQAEFTFLHGHERPPVDLRDAARQAAIELAKGKMNSRVPATADSMSAGGFTFNFAHQADLKRGRPFGMPDVDAVVMSHAAEIPAVA